jgi:hypothetical protein
MIKSIKIILFLIIVYIIIYIILSYNKIIKLYDNNIFYNYDYIKKKLKTGDIILFSYKKNDSLFNKIKYFCHIKFLKTGFNHAGLIFKENKKIYIVESDMYNLSQCTNYLNNKQKGGIRIVEFETLLKEYKKRNRHMFAIKFISKPIPNNLFKNVVLFYKNYTFPNKISLYLSAFIDEFLSHDLANIFANNINFNKTMCSEFVYNVLHKCNVLKKYPSKFFWPYLITDKKFDNLQIIKYSVSYNFFFY